LLCNVLRSVNPFVERLAVSLRLRKRSCVSTRHMPGN
jgi:hypothetical protein